MAEFVNLEESNDSLPLKSESPQIINIESSNSSEIISLDIKPYQNIESSEQSLEIIPNNSTSLENVTPSTNVLDNIDGLPEDNTIYTIDDIQGYIIPEESIECDIGCCDAGQYYGDANQDDSFKRSNLFSELTDEYQRAVARFNLGIAGEYSMIWGNISGNLANQVDLYSFILDQIASNINILINDINTKLAQWAYDIKTSLDQKANIASPNFTGIPTTTLPALNDDSNRIASTEWVNAKISNSSAISTFTLDKEYMFYGDAPTNVVCSWDYNSPIESQKINGIDIPVNSRSYTFTNINSEFIINLKYVINGETFTKSIMFQKYYPIYYGVSNNYLNCTKTKDNEFILNCNTGEYAYLIIPLKNKARIAVDNIVGGFTLQGSILISSITFYIYKSVNSGLGELYLNIL